MIPPDAARTALARCLGSTGLGADAWRWSVAGGGMSDACVLKAAAGERAFAVRRLPGWADRAARVWLGAALRDAARTLPCLAAPVADPVEAPEANGPTLWEVAPWRAGTPLTGLDRTDADVAMACLAQLHAELRTMRPGPEIARADWQGRLTRLGGLASEPNPLIEAATANAFPDLAEAVARLPHAAGRALERLERCEWRRWPVQLVHGDARPEHFLIEAGRVTGLIDFDAMRIDSPIADVARLAGELACGERERLAELASAYSEQTGASVDAATVRAVDGANAVLAAANWAGWLRDAGASRFDPAQLRPRLASIRARLPS